MEGRRDGGRPCTDGSHACKLRYLDPRSATMSFIDREKQCEDFVEGNTERTTFGAKK